MGIFFFFEAPSALLKWLLKKFNFIMPLLTLQHSIILVWSFTILKNGWWTGASEMEQAKYCSDEATWFLSFTTDFAFAGWSCQRSNSPDMALSHAQHQARKSSFYTLIYFQICSAVMPFIMSWRIWLFFFFFFPPDDYFEELKSY